MEPSRHYWIYSPGEQANRWDEFREAGILALSYNEGAPNDLRSYGTEEDLIKSFQKVAGDTASHKNDVKALMDLRDVLKPGDLVFAKRGQKTIVGVGRVVGEYEFAADASDMQHRRPVEWFDVKERTIKNNAPLKTLTDITPYADFLVRLADACDIEDLYTESQFRMWDDALEKWPMDTLRNMTLAQYNTLGAKDSFCYLIESKLQDMGSVWGGSAYKFGIFEYNTNDPKPLATDKGNSQDNKYRWYTKYGDTADAAFETVRSRIVQIAEYASQANYGAIDSIDFSPAIKWKIAFLYQNRDSMGVVDIYKKEMVQQAVGIVDSNVPMSQLYAKAFSMMSSPEDVFAWAHRSWRKIDGVEDAIVESTTDPENTKMVEKMDKNPRTIDWMGDFRGWFKAYGPQHGYNKYIQALEDPHAVVKFRKDNPSQGHEQADDLDLTKFPPEGQPCLSLYRRDDIKALFEETKSFRVGDDGALHTALGYYALWLRIVAFEYWKDEPFWEGDDTAPGGKSRKATLLSNGFDYDEVYANRKATYKMDKYLAAIRTKPFVLLAGISGTGKSRMVRELARGCCPEWKDDAKTQKHPLFNEQKPGNFEMIQVRPNWHDSSELMGYVSRINGTDEYQVTDFVKFLCKAWRYEQEGIPFFLCLDEMNLAPVEQYFAEYLSVVETRKHDADGKIVTDPLIRFKNETVLQQAVKESYASSGLTQNEIDNYVDQFKKAGGIPIPSNLVVMGTVNMDETTFSFSRKVLDRAMSFELNEVIMNGGLEQNPDIPFGSLLGAATPTLVKGFEAYQVDKAICDAVVKYLEGVNKLLEGTPFKIAYRTRDEVMIYCIERCGGGGGFIETALPSALDEATSMKVLSRIEGDSLRLVASDNFTTPLGYDRPTNLLGQLKVCILEGLKAVDDANKDLDGEALAAKYPICAKKLDWMAKRLAGGFTGFWQ